jgi:uncharacterized repeat protein (TIGR01451 family)
MLSNTYFAPGNNTETFKFNVIRKADLEITSIVYSPNPGVAGQDVTITINYRNNGPGVATGVVITDNSLDGLENVTYYNGSTWVAWSGTSSTIPTLNIGVPSTLQIKGKIPAGQIDPISYWAEINGTSVDGNLDNNR